MTSRAGRQVVRGVSLAGLWLLAAPHSQAFAQTMPGGVYVALANLGHERLADRIADRLKPTAHPDRGDVEDLLKRWDRATGGPATGSDWLTVARLWLRAGEALPAASALRRASGDIPSGLFHLDAARIGFLSGEDAAEEQYWQACAVADDETAQETWLDLDLLATPTEADAWDAFRRLPAGQRDGCAFLRRFWSRRAAASGMPLDERIRLHYERLRFALDHYTRRGRTQEAAGSGHLNARLGREARPVFDDRGLLYLRLGPPDETASFFGGECYEPNVSWYYRFPAGDRMYHLSPTTGVDNWWLISNLAEVFRCPVGPDGTVIQDRNPMVALPPNLSQIPASFLREIYLSRASLDPEYARIAYRFDRFDTGQTAQALEDERDLTWADGLYAVTDVPERPDVAQDIGFVVEWVEFRLPRAEATRVWLLAAISGEDLARVWRTGDVDGAELVVSALDEATGELSRFSGRLAPSDPGSDVVARLPLELRPGSYSVRVIIRAGAARKAAELEAERPSGGYLETPLAVRDFSGALPRLSDIAVSPDSGGSWAQVDRVALSPTPAHVTNASGRMWVYFEAYNLTPGGAYSATVNLAPEDDGTPFDLEFSGTAESGGRVMTRSGLRLDLADSPPGRYRLSLTLRDVATGRVTLPAQTWIEIRPPTSLSAAVGVQP